MTDELHFFTGGMKKRFSLFLIIPFFLLGTLYAGSADRINNSAFYFSPPDSIPDQDKSENGSSFQGQENLGGGENDSELQRENAAKFGAYPFLKTSQNFIEWQNSEAATAFFTKFAEAKNRKLRILHIGDSHLQADIYTGYMREELQRTYGVGGRGLVFPYSAAKTHSAYDYFTYSKGNWTYAKNTDANPKLDVGLLGYSVKTTDPNANFKLVFSKTIQKAGRNRIKIFVDNSPTSFDVQLKVKGIEEPITLSPSQGKDGYVETVVDSDCESIELFVKKTSDTQQSFECYGLLIESDSDGGVLYGSAGVNGATLAGIWKQKRFEEEIKIFKPDLFVLDLGINNFFTGGFDKASLKKDLNTIISKVKEAAPEATIMLVDVQDAFNKRSNVEACKDFALLVQETAFENGCLFYDIYNVSGGRNSMLFWRSNYLANVDQIHLTSKGYNLKGELFLNAIDNSFKKYAAGDQQFVLNNKVLDGKIPDNLAIYTDNNEAQSLSASNTTVIAGGTKNPAPTSSAMKDEKGTYKIHKVLGGESIRSIAKLYNVEISDIRDWNNFYGALALNQELKIYTKTTKAQPVATASRAPAKNTGVAKSNYNAGYSSRNYNYNASQKTNYGYANRATPTVTNYSVRNGDTWYAISKRTGIPINQLKAANGTNSDNIVAGQNIKIPGKTYSGYAYGKQTYGNRGYKNYNTATTTKATQYSVRSGDTWSAISKRTGIPVNQLKAANGTKSDNIRPGQKIKIPGKTYGKQNYTNNRGNAGVTNSSQYSVRSGDTWSAISQRTGIPVNQLKAANGTKSDNIRPGQKIKIPGKQPAGKKSAVKKPAAKKPAAKKPAVKKAPQKKKGKKR